MRRGDAGEGARGWAISADWVRCGCVVLQDGRSAYCCVCGDAGVWVRGDRSSSIGLEVSACLSCLRSGGEKGGRSWCVVELMVTCLGEGDGQFWTARLPLLRLRDCAWG